jgi:hypothetical protein
LEYVVSIVRPVTVILPLKTVNGPRGNPAVVDVAVTTEGVTPLFVLPDTVVAPMLNVSDVVVVAALSTDAVTDGSAGILADPEMESVPPANAYVTGVPLNDKLYAPFNIRLVKIIVPGVDVLIDTPPSSIRLVPGLLTSTTEAPIDDIVLIVFPTAGLTVIVAVVPLRLMVLYEAGILYSIHRKKVHAATFLRNISSIYTQYSYFAAKTGALTRPSSSR